MIKVQALRDSVRIPLIVISRQDENLTSINSILRKAGHAVHCIRLSNLSDLEETIRDHQPELLILFADESELDLPIVSGTLSRMNPIPPLIVIRNNVSEDVIADAMKSGARDAVSLAHPVRFQAVVDRELRAFRLKTALNSVVSSASQYKQELRNLMKGATEAIADTQEGIIVGTNPVWLSLFGREDESELIGHPFMDLFRESDRPTLKGALVACLKERWDGASLQVAGCRLDNSEIPLELKLEHVSIDGEPGVRVIIPNDKLIEQTPEEQIEQALFRDPSTGFYHRRYYLERLEEQLATPLAGGVRAVAYIRPDHFAKVHDDIGPLATEALLMHFSEVLRELMQPRDLYGRFGGTIFAVLLERGNMQDVEAWAEQVCNAIGGNVFEVEQQSTSLTCTIGLCEVSSDTSSVADLLSEVEQACRNGRKAGGNRVEFSDTTCETQQLRIDDAMWIPRLRTALMQNQLRLVHQPITGLNEEIEGVLDTHVRLMDEEGNYILPREFMGAAERGNMMKSIDRWVIGAAFSFCASKNLSLLFIRLSGDSVGDDSLVDWLLSQVKAAGIKPGQICFEVHEELAAQHLKQTMNCATRLKAADFNFAVDHLGTGRTSQQVIEHVPMDFGKIDGALMQGLHRNQEQQQKVGELARKASGLGIKTIAERVEDANTMAVLWQLGIAFIQGNYVQDHGVVLEDTNTVRGLECR